VAQGVAQWELWSGKRAPEGRMRAAVLAALKDEARVRAHKFARAAAQKTRDRA
jgi:hypothetical protein